HVHRAGRRVGRVPDPAQAIVVATLVAGIKGCRKLHAIGRAERHIKVLRDELFLGFGFVDGSRSRAPFPVVAPWNPHGLRGRHGPAKQLAPVAVAVAIPCRISARYADFVRHELKPTIGRRHRRRSLPHASQVGEAFGRFRLGPRAVEGRQQNRDQQSDDRNNDEQLNECKGRAAGSYVLLTAPAATDAPVSGHDVALESALIRSVLSSPCVARDVPPDMAAVGSGPGPTDALISKNVGIVRRNGSLWVPRVSQRAASTPSRDASWQTAVNVGCTAKRMSVSSKPMIDKSAGMRTPNPWARWTAPSASTGSAKKTAVGAFWRLRSMVMIVAPPASVDGWRYTSRPS